jgi:hypothetical protein
MYMSSRPFLSSRYARKLLFVIAFAMHGDGNRENMTLTRFVKSGLDGRVLDLKLPLSLSFPRTQCNKSSPSRPAPLSVAQCYQMFEKFLFIFFYLLYNRGQQIDHNTGRGAT